MLTEHSMPGTCQALHILSLLFDATTLGSENYYYFNVTGKETEVQREPEVRQQAGENQNQPRVTCS